MRMTTMSLGEGVSRVVWYSLEGPGWRNSGLLDDNRQLRPAYIAYQALISQLRGASLPPTAITPVAGIEGYRFTKPEYIVDVIWSTDAIPHTVQVPASKF